MKFFNLTLALAIVSALVACDTKRNPYYAQEESQFILGSIDAKSAPTSQSASTNETNRITYNFEACIKDLTGASVPPRMKFGVKIGTQSQIRTTNRNGCLDWAQEIGFNPLVVDRYYILTFVISGQNELGGEMSVDVAINPWLDDVINLHDKQNKRLEGIQLEKYEAEGFVITNISKGSVEKPTATEPNTVVIPQSNVIPDEKTPLRMKIQSVSVSVEKRNETAPYTVDQNLDLFVHKVYKFNADVKFFKQTSKDINKEVVPSGGKYRITLALLNEPNFDIPSLWDDLKDIHLTEDIIKGKNKSKSLAALATVLEKYPTQFSSRLTSNDKRRLIAKALIQYVQQTLSFDLNVTPEEGFKKNSLPLTLKELEMANTRAILAVTIQPLDEDFGNRIKSDGADYIGSLADPGQVSLNTWPIEADLLHAERLATENTQKVLNPLELFFQASYLKMQQQKLPRERAFQPMEKADIAANQFPVAIGKAYPFERELDTYLSNAWNLKPETHAQSWRNVLTGDRATLENNAKIRRSLRLFNQSICYKAFHNSNLKNATEEQMIELAMVCASRESTGWLVFNKLDFVADTGLKPAERLGLPMPLKLSAARSLGLGLQSSTSWGWKFDASASASASASVDTFAPLGFNVSVGPSLFFSTGKSTSVSNGSSISVAGSIDFNVEATTFQFERNTRKCMVITYTDLAKKQMEKAKISFPDGYVACSATASPRKYQDTYFMVTQACPSDSQLADCKSRKENVIRLMIRGKNFYEHFDKMVKSQTDLGLLLEKVPDESLQNYVKHLGPQLEVYRSNQVAPGVVPASQEVVEPAKR